MARTAFRSLEPNSKAPAPLVLFVAALCMVAMTGSGHALEESKIVPAFPSPALPRVTLSDGYPACTSYARLRVAVEALAEDDYAKLDRMTDCAMIPAGTQFRALGKPWAGVAKIMLFLPEGSAVVWADREAIE